VSAEQYFAKRQYVGTDSRRPVAILGFCVRNRFCSLHSSAQCIRVCCVEGFFQVSQSFDFAAPCTFRTPEY
jgi:hypothetical protein